MWVGRSELLEELVAAFHFLHDHPFAVRDREFGADEVFEEVGQAGSEDPDTVPNLVKLLKSDKEESVKIAAAEGLGLLGTKAKDAVNDLRSAAKDADKKSKLAKVITTSIKSINGTKK